MNPFPSPLLCLYCDKIILPGNAEGCRDHMFRCVKHPARGLIDALNLILNEIRHEGEPSIETIDKLAEDALR